MVKKLISLISPCFNFIDNASTDGTVAALKGIAVKDRRVKIIVNW